jgi:hypothetical protein
VRLEEDGLAGVGDPGGFPVGGGDADPAGIFRAQCGGRARGQDAEVAGQPGLRAGGQAFAEGAGPVVEGGGGLMGDWWGTGGRTLGLGRVAPQVRQGER